MPITTLDRQTALVVIDLQKAMLSLDNPKLLEAVRNTRDLADAFRDHQLPVVWITVAGSAPGRKEQALSTRPFTPEGLNLIPELGAQPGDLKLTKRTWGAFLSTDLERELCERQVTGIVLAGVSTSIGVESTARQAFELGFNVTVALDATVDMSPDAYHHSVTRIFPRLGETAPTAEILGMLERTHPLQRSPRP